MRFLSLQVTLPAVLAAAIFTVSLFPPSVRPQARSVEPGPVKRAVFLPPILAGYVTIDQGVSHILAASKPARDWGMAGLLPRIYPALKRLPLTGTSVIPDPEQILLLKADAVFVYGFHAGILKRIGFPGLMAINIDSQNPIHTREKIWRRMGEISGQSPRVTALLARYAAHRAALQKLLPQDPARRVRVVLVHVFDGGWFAANNKHYVAYKLKLAGARNLNRNLRFTARADLEKLLVLDPDVILFASNPGDKTTLREIIGRPEFQALRAVREHRAYKMPFHTYLNEMVEDPLLLTWMAEVFYPHLMPRKLREEYQETYQAVYHYAISEAEIERAIYLEENRQEAGYERFASREARR